VRAKESINYYELLQIPCNADEDAIRRAYRSMASRVHPDNPDTGNVERFLLLQQAFRVLSDPASRAKYDSVIISHEEEAFPVFELNNFVIKVDSELKRRLSLLALLYHRRRIEDERPGMSVLELEQRLAFHREDLNFTLWYLSSKNYVKRELNSEYTLTALGADYVEGQFQSRQSSTAA
jgi:curved DNA-binding protein CbpA